MPTQLKSAMWHNGSNCYQCPMCSCGAVPDWRGEAPLRCTGCKQPLVPRDTLFPQDATRSIGDIINPIVHRATDNLETQSDAG